VPVAVDLHEALHGLIVAGECLIRVPCHPQNGGEVHQDGEKEVLGDARFPAEVVGLSGQFLGTAEITYGAPVVDQVGGGPERVDVVVAQVVTVPLKHVLAFLQRLPVIAGLA
jgi:hypothetical protein